MTVLQHAFSCDDLGPFKKFPLRGVKQVLN
uniref:Uncharacterized protein n=1 Tax=Arundo donax TaxID=35708 RepID=A0A0A9A2X0_ARUDO